MNSLSRFIRLLLWAILLGGIVSLLRRRARSFARRADGPVSPLEKAAPRLRRDPFCGTYIAPEISFTADQAGQLLHFCSAECRDRYLHSGRQAAGA